MEEKSTIYSFFIIIYIIYIYKFFNIITVTNIKKKVRYDDDEKLALYFLRCIYSIATAVNLES